MERFWEKVDKTTDCWIWTASKNKHGYGYFRFEGRMVKAHIWAYENVNGPVPDGLELDHLCRNTSCVRVDHLEAVPHRINVLRGNGIAAEHFRKKFCKNGHAFSLENIRITKYGRVCIICYRISNLRAVKKYQGKRKMLRIIPWPESLREKSSKLRKEASQVAKLVSTMLESAETMDSVAHNIELENKTQFYGKTLTEIKATVALGQKIINTFESGAVKPSKNAPLYFTIHEDHVIMDIHNTDLSQEVD